MKSKRAGKGREYFKDLPKVDFKKFMAKVKKRGYLFYRPAKKEVKDESEN
jgi:hypothetical protein